MATAAATEKATSVASHDFATGSGDSDSVVTGSWSQTRGSLKLTVTEVDIQGGYVLLHLKADNHSQAEMDLPTFGYFVATDDTGATYGANEDDTKWPITVPAGMTVTGVIELNAFPSASAHTLTISFGTVFGQSAPSGGISVKGVKLRA